MKSIVKFRLETDSMGEITNTAEKELYEEAVVDFRGGTPLNYHLGYECTVGNIIGRDQFYILETLECDFGSEITLHIFSEEKEFIDKAKTANPRQTKDFYKRVLSNYISEEALDDYI